MDRSTEKATKAQSIAEAQMRYQKAIAHDQPELVRLYRDILKDLGALVD